MFQRGSPCQIYGEQEISCLAPSIDKPIIPGSDVMVAFTRDDVIHENMVFNAGLSDNLKLQVRSDPVVYPDWYSSPSLLNVKGQGFLNVPEREIQVWVSNLSSSYFCCHVTIMADDVINCTLETNVTYGVTMVSLFQKLYFNCSRAQFHND